MFRLSHPVGDWSKRRGVHWNTEHDVKIVQCLLNEQLKSEKINSNQFSIPLDEDGQFGKRTKAAIDYFQVHYVKLFHHDSVVDIKGPTIERLKSSVPETKLTQIWNSAIAVHHGVSTSHAQKIAHHSTASGRLLKLPATAAGVKSVINSRDLPNADALTDKEFNDYQSLTLVQIKEIIASKNNVLVKADVHTALFEAAQLYKVNPKLLLASLAQEQSWGKAPGGMNKLMGVGSEGNPQSMMPQDAMKKAASIYRIGYDKASELQAKGLALSITINTGFKYMARTAAEYARLRYTPWTYYAPQSSRPYDQWVGYVRGFA